MGKFLRTTKKALPAVILSVSGSIASAAETLPYSCDFSTQDLLSAWQSIDVDGDGHTWEIGQPDYGSDMAKSLTAYSNFGDADNRFISPLLSFPSGKNISIKFKYYTSYYVTEILDIYLSTTPLTGSLEDGRLIQTLNLNSYYGSEQTIVIPALENEGEYYLNLIHRASVDNNFGFVLYITNLQISEVMDGNLTGIVSGENGPLSGASVSISGAVNRQCYTDINGAYTFEEIPADSYSVEFSAFGYNTVNKTFEVQPEQTTNGSVTLSKMQTATVSGKVTDSEGTPLQGAEVRLEGYTPYRTYTDNDGNYSIPGVYLYDYYASSPYTLNIQRNNFVAAAPRQITMYYDYNAGTTKLNYDILPPSKIEVSTSENGNIVSWERPVTKTLLKHDNGNPTAPLGYDNGRYENILGTIYREPMKVSDLEWYTFDNYGENTKVTIYIMDLDESGTPTGNIIYSAMDIDNIPEEWNTFHIDNPIECSNGFMLAMSGEGNVCLAKDDSENVEPRTQLYSNTYASPSTYTYFEDVNYKGALCLRASGEKIQTEIPLKLKYVLSRLNVEDQDNEEAWETLLTDSADLSYDDSAYASLPRGSYQYAVKAVYDIDEVASEALLSDVVERLQSTDLNVSVTTNSVPEDAEGAKVTLTSGNGEILIETVKNGIASFNDIRKASDYHLEVSTKGFNSFETDLDLNMDESYEVEALLTQVLAPAANIDIVREEEENILIFDFFPDIDESFETDDYADFEINPAGEIGWQYIDGDAMPTYGFYASTFPGMGSRMAAVILDSSKTEPMLTRDVANNGFRALGFFCPKMTINEGGAEVKYQADDWLISPELNYHRDFTFSFLAMTWESQENRLENIRVGYSLDGCEPEDFIFLDPETGVNVPLSYTEYSYQMPKEAKYVALNSRSDDVFLLCVDDIRMTTGCINSGEAPSVGHFLNYEVKYNDEEPLVTTSNRISLSQFTPQGTNNIQVSKVYNSGKSEPISISYEDGSGIRRLNSSDNLVVSYGANRLRVNQQCRLIEVFSAEGACVASVSDSEELLLNNLSKGVYIARVTSIEGITRSVRVIVR